MTEKPKLGEIVSMLVQALVGLTPTCRKVGQCWCQSSRDIEGFGHSSECGQAHAALLMACSSDEIIR